MFSHGASRAFAEEKTPMFKPLQARTLSVASDAMPTRAGEAVLIAQRVQGSEALGSLFEYRLELATLDSPTCRLSDAQPLVIADMLIGKSITISIEFEGKGTCVPGLAGSVGTANVGAGVRTITGLITSVASTGSDDRRAYYEFTVRPWLGSGAVIGEQVPDRQYHFRIVIGPLDIEDYYRFTPQGADLLLLIEWVRAFVSEEFNWELELQIKPQSAPPAVLGGPQQLGWSGWMGRSRSPEPVTGMRFEPERYVQQLRQNAATQARQPRQLRQVRSSGT
ncbi:type VI secretion system baseplate subunit TssG [Paraburkholderia sp.]|uniref:type VI secretion system baseplate subunit TssG n=1 Tax=Paraburkholderia sp. TaxID=1926495 RepID=UPI0039C9A4C7